MEQQLHKYEFEEVSVCLQKISGGRMTTGDAFLLDVPVPEIPGLDEAFHRIRVLRLQCAQNIVQAVSDLVFVY